MPAETVTVTFETDGQPEEHSYTGVRLIDALELVGLAVAPEEENPLLTRYLIVRAKDRYHIVLSGGELAPQFGDAPILLAWEQDGEPLSEEEAPVRLVVPGDTDGGRYVYGVIQIEVLSVDDLATTD